MVFQETTHKIIGIAMNSKESSAIMMQARMTYENATMECECSRNAGRNVEGTQLQEQHAQRPK